MHQKTGLHRFPGGAGPVSLSGIVIVLLVLAMLSGSTVTPARASLSDEKLQEITRTTIYGAVLGGLLGLASALVVDKDYRDDAVRWGVALGSFGGFAFGVASSGDDDLDDFSFNLDRRRPGRADSNGVGAGLMDGGRSSDQMRNVQKAVRSKLLSGIEVSHGALEEEGEVRETYRGSKENLLGGKEVSPGCFGP